MADFPKRATSLTKGALTQIVQQLESELTTVRGALARMSTRVRFAEKSRDDALARVATGVVARLVSPPDEPTGDDEAEDAERIAALEAQLAEAHDSETGAIEAEAEAVEKLEALEELCEPESLARRAHEALSDGFAIEPYPWAATGEAYRANLARFFERS